jgi:ATP-dependent DNA helicase RecQ
LLRSAAKNLFDNRKTAEEIANFLAFEGLGSSARFYHAGMRAHDRSDVQEWFLNSKDGIVVSTVAFGMGVNKSNIRYVYHFNLPKSLEGYAQVVQHIFDDNLA